MAPVPLTIAPAFRPWHQTGITWLLFDEATISRIKESTGRNLPWVTPAPVPVIPKNKTPDQEHRPAAAQPEPEAVRATAQAVARQISTDPSLWPGYWLTLLRKTPQKPQIVWTYPSLSRDISGTADAAHRAFLQRLLKDMGLPRGANAFWPLNAYPYPQDGGENTVDAHMFMSGIDVLNPDWIILMCGEAPAGLGLDGLRRLNPTVIQGRHVVITHHVDTLILQPGKYTRLISFLKGQITGH